MARLVDAMGKPIPTERNLRTVMGDAQKIEAYDSDNEVTGKINLAELGLTFYGQKDCSFDKFKSKECSNPLLAKKA